MAIYAVTGAAGRAGGAVADRLLAAGKQVRAIDKNVQGLARLAAKGAQPFEGLLEDAAVMARAFQGASAAFLTFPPERPSREYYPMLGRIVAGALDECGVTHAVSVSGVTAHLSEKTGHFGDFYHLEQALNEAENVNILHMRAGFLMENLLTLIARIKSEGVIEGALRGDLAVPQIALRDVAEFATEALLKANFTGKSARELLGPCDLTMDETARVVAKALDMPSLRYVQPPFEEMVRILIETRARSLPEELRRTDAELRMEAYTNLNNGIYEMCLEERSARNTTPTTIEAFVTEVFLPQFRAQ
jgi:uncharacterized protein YbjT (DUF2867 family)